MTGRTRRASSGILWSNLDVTRFDRLHGKVPQYVTLAELRIAGRIRIIIKEEGTANHVSVFSGFAIVLHREINSINKARVVGSSGGAPKKRNITDNLHTGNIDLQLIFLTICSGESRVVQNSISLHASIRITSCAEGKLPSNEVTVFIFNQKSSVAVSLLP